MSDEDPDEPTDAPTGEQPSLAEEASRLFAALAGAANQRGSDLGDAFGGLTSQTAEGWRQVNEHLATGASECTYCPVCRIVRSLRETSPEVRANLAVASASLMRAAAGLLATAVPDDRSGTPRTDAEHIPVADRWPEDEPQ